MRYLEVDVHAHHLRQSENGEMLGWSTRKCWGRPLAGFMTPKAGPSSNATWRCATGASPSLIEVPKRDGGEADLRPLVRSATAPVYRRWRCDRITDRRASTELIWHQANFDELTGLPNRHMFMDRLRQEIKKADRGGAFLALVFLDLDHFKEVNDQFGHATGDALLVQAARRIGACVRGSDTLARLGGDEFTVILAGIDHAGSVERIAQALVASLAHPFELGGEKVFISASAGVALYPPDAADVDELLGRADQAMYASKKAGRNRFSWFTPELQEAALARQVLAAGLREAIAAQQFEIVYQPILCLATGTVRKAEALLRWRHPTRGLLAPAEFIPFAESNGLIVEIGDWVFREAARRAAMAAHDPPFSSQRNKSPVQPGAMSLYQPGLTTWPNLACPSRASHRDR
jgi:diguanylate cyclase (GGDEF)-like protein